MMIKESYSWPQFLKIWGQWETKSGDMVSAIKFKDRTRLRIWIDRKEKFYNLYLEIERTDPKFKKWIGKRRTRTK